MKPWTVGIAVASARQSALWRPGRAGGRVRMAAMVAVDPTVAGSSPAPDNLNRSARRLSRFKLKSR